MENLNQDCSIIPWHFGYFTSLFVYCKIPTHKPPLDMLIINLSISISHAEVTYYDNKH